MNKLDRIFYEKLSDHTTSPSPSAWARVDAGLSKKNSTIAWMRWAAVLLPGVVAAALWLSKTAETPPVARTITKAEAPADANTVVLPSPQPVAVTVTPRKTAKSSSKAIRKMQESIPAPAEEPELSTQLPRPEAISMTDVTIEPADVAAESSTEVIGRSKPIVLVFTLETIAAPDQEEKKPSTLERAVEIARTVKHSDPLSDLRVMKDEILALDLRKKSTKKN